MPSARRMKPVQAIGVFQEANGSMPASVAASEPTIRASPASADAFT
jgi:hypothetical protein